MAVQVQIPVTIAQAPDSRSGNGNSLNRDGTLPIDYLFGLPEISVDSWAWIVEQVWRKLKRDLLIAPAFLGFVAFIVLFVPRKLFQFRSFISDFFRAGSKRALDVVGSGVGLLISTGLFFYLPAIIRLDSKGEVIFKQRRIGKDRRNGNGDRRKISLMVPVDKRKGNRREVDLMGQPFNVYKFRSMREDAEKKTGPTWAKKNDPRITRIGRILRPTHLDEIPQFVNVLKGDMSLVGPRPERPEIIPKLTKEMPNYTKRLTKKPGVTGLAQVSWGYDATMADVAKKLRYDLFYIENGNLLFDIRILLSTLKMVVLPGHHKNGHTTKIMPKNVTMNLEVSTKN